MYAVVRAGGKQARVEPGQRLDVERVGAAVGDDITLTPVLVVDGETVLASADELANASASARVVGETKGPKVIGFTYKKKNRTRRRWGHRQQYDTIEITGIDAGQNA